MVPSFDDARLYATGTGDSILVSNLTSGATFAFQSGIEQFGVVDRPLPAHVGRVTGDPQPDVEGSLVSFAVGLALQSGGSAVDPHAGHSH